MSRRLLLRGTRRLEAAGIAYARREAEWLLSRLLQTSPLELYLQEQAVSIRMAKRFLSDIDARAQGVPCQYLLGEAEFFGEPFVVGPGVFIPRPETEAVLEAALEAFGAIQEALLRPLRLLDLGTGSGCIAFTLAKHLPTCLVVAVELSWNALRTARQNRLRHGLSSRVSLIQGRWCEPVRGVFDGVISNPPYIPSPRVDCLPRDVRYEPRLSLDGGADGLRDLRELIEHVPRVLRPGGLLVLECGEDQVEALARAAAGASWTPPVSRIVDLAGRPRGLVLRHQLAV